MNYDSYIALANKQKNDLIAKSVKTGDVLKVKSEFLPFVFHYVIVQKTNNDFVIIHNDPHKINFLGGNIIREDFEDWIIGKEIVEVIPTRLAEKDIDNIVNDLKTTKFDAITWNCEHFISKLNFQKPKSPQIFNWSVGIATLIATIIIIRKYK